MFLFYLQDRFTSTIIANRNDTEYLSGRKLFKSHAPVFDAQQTAAQPPDMVAFVEQDEEQAKDMIFQVQMSKARVLADVPVHIGKGG